MKLKCCPFCGSDDVEVIECPRPGWWHVICNPCAAEGPADTKERKAVSRWNAALRDAPAPNAERTP